MQFLIYCTTDGANNLTYDSNFPFWLICTVLNRKFHPIFPLKKLYFLNLLTNKSIQIIANEKNQVFQKFNGFCFWLKMLFVETNFISSPIYLLTEERKQMIQVHLSNKFSVHTTFSSECLSKLSHPRSNFISNVDVGLSSNYLGWKSFSFCIDGCWSSCSLWSNGTKK